MYVDKFYKTPSYREEMERAREMNARIISIQSALLPEASHLAVLYGSEEVSMHQYRSIEKFLGRVEYHVSTFYALDDLLSYMRGMVEAMEQRRPQC
jgi:hypothetical protein